MPPPPYESIGSVEVTQRNNPTPPIRNRILGGCFVVIALVILTLAVVYTCIWSPGDYSVYSLICGQTGPSFTGNPDHNVRDVWNASVHEYPFYAILYDAGDKKPFCSGAMIDEQWMVTSAHCLVKRATGSLKNFRVSTAIRTKGEIEYSSRSVIKVFVHDKYKFPERPNDIALVKFSNEVMGTRPFINCICLEPKKSIDEHDKHEHFILGFGTHFNGSRNSPDVTSDVLKVTRVNLPGAAACDSECGHNIYDHESMICVHHWNTTTKHQIGDSGGPLFYKDSKGSYILTGINTCDATGKLGLYVRVNYFYDWIQAKVVAE